MRRDHLAKLMDGLHIHDVGCIINDPRGQTDPISKSKNHLAPVRAINIYNDLEVEAKLIFIPPGQKIPLHDHVGMTVFQRTLMGEMRYTDGDLDPTDTKMVGKYELTKVIGKDDFIVDENSPTLILNPELGNLHEVACYGDVGTCFLDLMSPPYCPVNKRGCNYYEMDMHGYARKIDAYNSADFCLQYETHPDHCPWVNEHKVAAALDNLEKECISYKPK